MRRVLPLVSLLLVVALGAPAVASAKLPAGFLGVQADGPLFSGQVDVGKELTTMQQSGVRSIRLAVYWDVAQPYATIADVPPDQAGDFSDEGGTPTRWGVLDLFIAGAAQRGLRLLPVIQRAPQWARKHPSVGNSPPSASGRQAYARFLTALIGRYGPTGAFWTAHPEIPRMPIRQWQVWNEPDGVRDWSDQPGIPAYVKLLKPAYAAVKAADPGAQVVLAGLVGRSWEDLQQVYDKGGGRFFDVAAIHPFSLEVSNVLKILRLARATMKRNGDAGKRLVVSELSWPSAKHKTKQQYGFEVSEQGQAAKIRQAVPQIAARRKPWKISAVFWSTWLSYDRDTTYSFDYAGLRRLRNGKVTPKPAFYAFRSVALRLER
jgi:hypothetical protein